ncbi:MAG: hypothetical protein QOF44_2302, partial [Streptomyces sp.]|nr:hypothetical protein [Streptomyces sp.]
MARSEVGLTNVLQAHLEEELGEDVVLESKLEAVPQPDGRSGRVDILLFRSRRSRRSRRGRRPPGPTRVQPCRRGAEVRWFSRHSAVSRLLVPSFQEPVREGGHISAQLLGQSDDDALRAADVAEQIAVLEPGDLADEFGAVRAQAG